MNRLARESSPYLRQHAHNPVDWWPWGEEAFDEARRGEKPVFLSIGYSSCHWCHVMERESFENEEIARLLNDSFVSIKVDREERPDVDDVYMTAVQVTTGHGGWPLSAFLLPDRRPFFAGTYFPPEDRHGRTGFRTLLDRVSEAWRERRGDLEQTAAGIAAEIRNGERLTEKRTEGPLDATALSRLTDALKRSADTEHGGFGRAPKFPPHLALEWLLLKSAEGDASALAMATATLDAMALGGIHDQLGGGFHRYSTDERWLVPHFEKMLTDNAQLLGLYARAFALTGRELYRRTARDTGDYLLREMRGAEGAFFAATDADSEGEEGKFFVWSEAEVLEALGQEDGKFFAALYRVEARGNFRDEASGRATGLNILHLARETTAGEEARLAPLRATLLARRGTRVPPALDDKRVAGWNALAVSGFAIASRALGEPRYLDAARTAARFLLTDCRDGTGRLQRTWKEGEAKILAFLEDEAFLTHALLDLAEAEEGDAAAAWASLARSNVDVIRSRFRRPGEPGFTFSGEGHEELLARGRDLFDKAIPSASGSATGALVRLALRSGDRTLAAEARAALEEVSWLMARAPHGTESWALALDGLLELERRHGAPTEAIARAAPTRLARAEAALDPVRIEAFVEPERISAGREVVVTLRITIRDGYALVGADGLTLEAWAGEGLALTKIERPSPVEVVSGMGNRELHLEGTVGAKLVFSARGPLVTGGYVIAVTARFLACGDGVCFPARVLSLAVPVEVAGL